MDPFEGSFLWKSEVQVLCCRECKECLNGAWYYPKKIKGPGGEMMDNPFQGRCRACGSRNLTVGTISKANAEKWERAEGWEFMFWNQRIDIPDPTLKRNIHIVGSGCNAAC